MWLLVTASMHSGCLIPFSETTSRSVSRCFLFLRAVSAVSRIGNASPKTIRRPRVFHEISWIFTCATLIVSEPNWRSGIFHEISLWKLFLWNRVVVGDLEVVRRSCRAEKKKSSTRRAVWRRSRRRRRRKRCRKMGAGGASVSSPGRPPEHHLRPLQGRPLSAALLLQGATTERLSKYFFCCDTVARRHELGWLPKP